MAFKINTYTFTADDIGSPEPITVTTECRKVTVQPSGGEGMFGYNFRAPLIGSTANLVGPGEATVFFAKDADVKSFPAGSVIGYIDVVSGGGTVTFIRREEG